MTPAEIGRRLRALLHRNRLEADLDEEMRLHLDLRQAQLEARGLPSGSARDAARQRFGRPLRLREESVDAWGWRWLEQLGQDLKFAARMLVKSPAFAATTVVTLALATGATTAIFSVVDGVLLQPLPFADPDRLVQVYGRSWSEDRGGPPDPLVGPVASDELDAYAQAGSFERFAGYQPTTMHLQGMDGSERLAAVLADGGLFDLLGVPAISGRIFTATDPLDVVVISAALWQRRFNSDPSIAGQTVVLDGQRVTILGVMPESFQFPYAAASILRGALPEVRSDVWGPLPPLRARGSGGLRRGRLSIVGRIKPGVTVQSAQSELRVIAARLEEQLSGTQRRVGVRLAPLRDVVTGPMRRSLWLLFAAVGLVLATACANVANLLLARMTVRTREVATRAALGASRVRLIRQFLAESLLLSLAGGVVAAFVARWGLRLIVTIESAKIPRAHEIAMDWRAFAFLLVACLATAVLFGVAPALTASRADLRTVTNASGGPATIGRRYGQIRDALVMIEVALGFVLALAAVLTIREVVRLEHVNTGMVTDHVLVLHLTPKAPVSDYYAIESRVAQLPGVSAAGFTQLVPLQNWGWEADFSIRGRPPSPGRRVTGLRYVTPGYFRALGIPVLRGRPLADSDTAEAPPVVVVNDALARRYFPGEDPVGRVLDRGTIVGVVGDVRNVGLDRPPDPDLFYPAAQNLAMVSDIGMSLVVRTAVPPDRLVEALRSTVHELNPTVAIFNVKTMEQVVADSLWELNLYRWLIGLFAALALLITAIGLYGVIAYHVSSRRREFAVRLALGSAPMAVARLVMGRAVRLAGAGLAAGVLTANAATPLLLRSLPVGERPGAVTYGVTAALLLAIAVLAGLVPAIRVASVNPATALRHD
ncbi:MAG: ABC transporter permease [Acidobacteriota bacterium]